MPAASSSATYPQVASLGRQNVKAYARIRKPSSRARADERTICRCGLDADSISEPEYPARNAHGFPARCAGDVSSRRCGWHELVAKEFVAAQNAADPGVLVLSDRTGAASASSPDALLVNPYDTRGVARALQLALEMPQPERRARHERLMTALSTNDIHAWHRQVRERAHRGAMSKPRGAEASLQVSKRLKSARGRFRTIHRMRPQKAGT